MMVCLIVPNSRAIDKTVSPFWIFSCAESQQFEFVPRQFERNASYGLKQSEFKSAMISSC